MLVCEYRVKKDTRMAGCSFLIRNKFHGDQLNLLPEGQREQGMGYITIVFPLGKLVSQMAS